MRSKFVMATALVVTGSAVAVATAISADDSTPGGGERPIGARIATTQPITVPNVAGPRAALAAFDKPAAEQTATEAAVSKLIGFGGTRLVSKQLGRELYLSDGPNSMVCFTVRNPETERATSTCNSREYISAGALYVRVGGEGAAPALFGVVPDGVTRVTLSGPDPVSVTPKDNTFGAQLGAGEATSITFSK